MFVYLYYTPALKVLDNDKCPLVPLLVYSTNCQVATRTGSGN